MSEQVKTALPPDEKRIAAHLTIPQTSTEIAEELGMDPSRVIECLVSLRKRRLVGMYYLSRSDAVYFSSDFPTSLLSSMFEAIKDGLPPITTLEGRKIRLSSDDVRLVACIGRAERYVSLSELARETGIDRPSLRWRLHDLVWLGVLHEVPLSGGRRQYTLTGLTMEQVETLEEMPRSPVGEPDGRKLRAARPGLREEPTEREKSVIEYLVKPATQEEIAKKFGYGRSRRSEVVRSLISKGLVRKCGSFGHKEFYISTDVSDEEADAFLFDLQKDGRDAARERAEKVYGLITEPKTVPQIRDLTGLSDDHVQEALETLVTMGDAIAIGGRYRTRYARTDASDRMTRSAAKWRDARLLKGELDILDHLNSMGGPVLIKEVARRLGMPYTSVIRFMRRLTSFGYLDRELDPGDPRRLLFSLRSKSPSAR